MNDTLELAPIERTADQTPTLALTPQAAASRAVMTVREATLARFSSAEIHLSDMATRYKNVAWDTSTPKALAATKAARQEMRQQGRFLVQKLVEETKSLLNDMKADVATEGDRLIAIIKPAEDAADAAIKAQEKADDDAKEVKRKAEADAAARVAGFEAEISRIANYPTLAQGKPSAAIAAGIKYVQGLDVSAEKWVEFTPRAVAAKEFTLTALDTLHVAALAAEVKAQQQADALAAAQKQQALVDELSELAGLPAAAKDANTLTAMTDAVGRAQAWDMDPARWGALHMAAVGTRTTVLTELAATLQAYSAAVEALVSKREEPAPAPEVTIAALAAFAEPDDEALAAPAAPVTDAASPVVLVDKADILMPREPQQQESRVYRSGGSIRPAAVVTVAVDHSVGDSVATAATQVDGKVVDCEIVAAPTPAPAPPTQEPTLSVSAICERFGEGLTMTRAYIETVLEVPADGMSPQKRPLWTERSFIAIASRLSQKAQEIALC